MRRAALIAFFVTATFAPLSAGANIGVPMVAVFLPPLWLSLIPVIAIEAWVITKLLNLRPVRCVAAVALGNVLSSVVGIPLMWAVLATVQGVFAGGARGLDTMGTKVYAVTVQAPWLIPYEEDLVWMIPVALTVLAFPAYLLSVLVEWRALLPFVGAEDRPRAVHALSLANAASYVLLAPLFAVMFQVGDQLRPLLAPFEDITGWFIDGVYMTARFFLGAQ